MQQETRIPPKFVQRYQALLGEEYDQFQASLFQPPVTFVRINTLKTTLEHALDRLAALEINVSPLPWFSAGFRITGNYEQLPFSNEYALGYFYIQEGASMLPPIALDPKPHHRVLDLCAAPGSKTTQLAQIMQNQGVIVANDRAFRRIISLGHNIQLCGIMNTIVLCEDGRQIAQRLPIQFDRILVDAPCTASGNLRSKPPQFQVPDKQRVTGIQALQKGLLVAAFRLLRPGGNLVYSTCSLYPEENEVVIQHLLNRFPDAFLKQPEISSLKSHPGIIQWEQDHFDLAIKKCLRIYPHENNTDGFFIALVGKEN